MANTRRSFHTGLIIGLPLLIALSAISGILLLDSYADEYRRTQRDLCQLQGYAQQMHAYEEQAVAEKGISEETQQGEEKVDAAVERELRVLLRSHPHNTLLLSVNRGFEAYDDALEAEYASMKQNGVEAAEKIANARVDPDFETLLRAVSEANVYFDAQAKQKNLLAALGTTVILLGCAAALSAFFLRFEKVRRREALQAALEQREAHVQSLISNVSDIIAVLDADSSVRFINQAAERLLGCPTNELIGQPILPLIHASDSNAAQRLLDDAIGNKTETTSELRLRNAAGSWLTFDVVATNLLADAHIQGLLVTLRDITERKTFEAQIEHQAFHDALAGLPNRALFMDRLHSALTRSQRHGKSVGVLFIDLDNFKIINDSLGHEAGDGLLKVISQRLQACVRPGDTVARLGGDEFTLLLEDLLTTEDALQIAERIFQQLKQPIMLSGHEIFASASVGIAMTPEAAGDADGLMRDADTAMYQAKLSGKSSYVLFDHTMNDRVVERMELENGLRRALDQGEFRVLYQPILDMETGKIGGAEALIRWEHPKMGLIPPAKFIPLAEETGLIVPIGAWILHEACLQARAWQDALPAHAEFVISVNLSGRQLQSPELVTLVADTLAETGLRPEHLKLEITESVMMEDIDAAIARLQQLKALGILLAVDDFGTGYSSLSYLRRLPVDTVKIDRSFISTMGGEMQPAAIVQTIIMLCRALNLNVTGEGIENPDQVVQLQALGCDAGQGYHFSRPVTAEDFQSLLQNGTIAPPTAPAEEQELLNSLKRAA